MTVTNHMSKAPSTIFPIGSLNVYFFLKRKDTEEMINQEAKKDQLASAATKSALLHIMASCNGSALATVNLFSVSRRFGEFLACDLDSRDYKVFCF